MFLSFSPKLLQCSQLLKKDDIFFSKNQQTYKKTALNRFDLYRRKIKLNKKLFWDKYSSLSNIDDNYITSLMNEIGNFIDDHHHHEIIGFFFFFFFFFLINLNFF